MKRKLGFKIFSILLLTFLLFSSGTRAVPAYAGEEDTGGWTFGIKEEEEVDELEAKYKDGKLYFYSRDSSGLRGEQSEAYAWAKKTFFIKKGGHLKFQVEGKF